jgi:hypothetical protein
VDDDAVLDIGVIAHRDRLALVSLIEAKGDTMTLLPTVTLPMTAASGCT